MRNRLESLIRNIVGNTNIEKIIKLIYSKDFIFSCFIINFSISTTLRYEAITSFKKTTALNFTRKARYIICQSVSKLLCRLFCSQVYRILWQNIQA